MLLDHGKPMNYEEAMMILNSDKWLEAMKFEIGSMYENKVPLVQRRAKQTVFNPFP